jgi:HlyD family secretion protein
MILVGLVVLALIGGAGYFGFRTTQPAVEPTISAPQTVLVTRGDVRQTVSAPGQLVTTRQVDLALDVGGRLAGVAVCPGDRVQEGDVLARLETSDLEEAVTRAELDLRQVRLRLEQLQEPADEAEIRRAQHAVDQAADALGVARINLSGVLSSTLLNKTLEDAQSAFQDAKNWYELRLRQHEEEGIDYWFVDQAQKKYKDAQLNLACIQYSADLQLESAHSQVNKAGHTYKEAHDDLQQLLEGADPADLEAMQLDVEAAQLDVEKARGDLEKATLVAPLDGVVLEVNGAPGDRISAGATLITLIDPTAVEARVTVIEEDLPLIEAGQPVELFFDARPEVAVQGHVARIVPQRVTGADRPLYPVHVALNELPRGLLPGMTVDGSITIAERTGVLRLPRALVRAGTGSTAQVEVWQDGHAQKRTIQVGLRGDVYVETLDGLREGEQVVGE